MTAPSAPEVIVGLDVGTTGVKAVAFHLRSEQRVQARRQYPLITPAPGQEVQDPEVIRAAAADALRECIRGLEGAEVAAVSLSAAMHGLIGLAGDGIPTTPLITWADGRAWREALDLLHSESGRLLQQTIGTPLHPMTPLAKMIWFARHEPETWKAPRWWVGLKDYLILWLTGTLATELSSASGTGLLDVPSRAWSPTALGICGLDPDRLPPILSPTATLPMAPDAARSLGLPVGTPVVLGAADGPLANVGTGVIEPGVAALSLGTSGAVRATVGTPVLGGEGGLFCYALTDSLWVVGAAVSNGADVVRWAAEGLVPDVAAPAGSVIDEVAALELAAGVEAGSAGLIMLPYLLPERAPIWRPGIGAAYLGLRREHTRAHMVRAAVEGVCVQMRLMLDRVDAVQPVRSVRATGGAFNSGLWRQVMAAAVGRPFHVFDGSEGTALGAAALGLHALDPSVGLAGALGQLGFPAVPPPPVQPSADVVAALDGIRSMTPPALAALAAVVGEEGYAGGSVEGDRTVRYPPATEETGDLGRTQRQPGDGDAER